MSDRQCRLMFRIWKVFFISIQVDRTIVFNTIANTRFLLFRLFRFLLFLNGRDIDTAPGQTSSQPFAHSRLTNVHWLLKHCKIAKKAFKLCESFLTVDLRANLLDIFGLHVRFVCTLDHQRVTLVHFKLSSNRPPLYSQKVFIAKTGLTNNLIEKNIMFEQLQVTPKPFKIKNDEKSKCHIQTHIQSPVHAREAVNRNLNWSKCSFQADIQMWYQVLWYFLYFTKVFTAVGSHGLNVFWPLYGRKTSVPLNWQAAKS